MPFQSPASRPLAATAATAIAFLGGTALLTEFARALLQDPLLRADPWLALGQVLFGDLRFFTILTNGFVTVLMGVTAAKLWRQQQTPSPAFFRAAAVYMLVTGAVYELMLRHLWSPQGLRFALDLVFHDIQPAATLLFWLIFAPKRDARWADLPWILGYPAIYFAVTLTIGALGAGYPYGFLDAGTLGYARVSVIAVEFLALFLFLGAGATLLGHVLTDDRSAAV